MIYFGSYSDSLETCGNMNKTQYIPSARKNWFKESEVVGMLRKIVRKYIF